MSKIKKNFKYATNYRDKHIEKEIYKLETIKKKSEVKHSNISEIIRSNTYQDLNLSQSVLKNKLPAIRKFKSQQENRTSDLTTKYFPVVFNGISFF